MAPIALAAQDNTVAAPLVDAERNPGNPMYTAWMSCTVSRAEVPVELVDEERNPGNPMYTAWMSCTIA
ncbi:hypothetical protein JCM10207_001494 [Rhodosporidiobolus poonsookiae]